MQAKTKVLDNVRVKQADGEPEGTFEAYASTYDRDSVGDRVVPGAFQKAIQKAEASESHWPVLWSHDTSDPWSNIGQITEAKETSEGLYVKGVIDLEDNPKAKQVHRLIKGGRVKQLSFMYSVKDGGFDESGEKSEDGSMPDYLLKELDVYEISFCHLGANQATRVISAKSADIAEKAVAGSYEQRTQVVQDALCQQYPPTDDVWVYVVATFDDSVVYRVSGGSDTGQWQVSYTLDNEGAVTLGDPEKVTMVEQVIPSTEKATVVNTDKADERNDALKAAAEALEAAHAAIKALMEPADDEKETQPTEPQVVNEESSEAKSGDEEQSETKSTNATQPGPVDYSDAEFELIKIRNNIR